MKTRRSFIALLSALPLMGWLKPTPIYRITMHCGLESPDMQVCIHGPCGNRYYYWAKRDGFTITQREMRELFTTAMARSYTVLIEEWEDEHGRYQSEVERFSGAAGVKQLTYRVIPT